MCRWACFLPSILGSGAVPAQTQAGEDSCAPWPLTDAFMSAELYNNIPNCRAAHEPRFMCDPFRLDRNECQSCVVAFVLNMTGEKNTRTCSTMARERGREVLACFGWSGSKKSCLWNIGRLHVCTFRNNSFIRCSFGSIESEGLLS